MLAVILSIAAWWYVRNAIIYDGDILGFETREIARETFGLEEFKPSNWDTYLNQGKSVLDMLRETGWIIYSLASFIAVFGYMDIIVNYTIYIFYAAIMGLGFIGCVIGLVKWFAQSKLQRKLNLFYLFSAISIPIPIIISIYYAYSVDLQWQGRYCLPMLVPLCFLITYGLENLFASKVFGKNIKGDYLINLVVILLFVSQLICFYTAYVHFHPYEMYPYPYQDV
jgi:hypothetical protein